MFCWQSRVRGAVTDDTTPTEIDPWMDHYLHRMRSPDLVTWAIYNHGHIGGYFEALHLDRGEPAEDDIAPDESLLRTAQVECVFKLEMFGLRYTRPALNMCLRALWTGEVETAFFPVFKHNRPLKELLYKIGASSIGAIHSRMQSGSPVETELYAITQMEWVKRNPEVVQVEEAQEVTA